MGDVTVPRNATVKLARVDGQLHLLERARVQAEGGSTIEVSGEVICQGDAEFEGSLSCSRLNVDHGRVEISGDLNSTVEIDVEHGELRIDGSLDASAVEVDARLFVGKSATAHDFDVGGTFDVGGSINATKVEVGGSFRVEGDANVEEIDVGGRVEVNGKIKCVRLDAGGSAQVGGGEISRTIDVGGSFASLKPLKFDKIDVGGTVTRDEGEDDRARSSIRSNRCLGWWACENW